MQRKTWREKMDNPDLPKLVPMLPNMRKRFGLGTMLVPSPREAEAFIRTVPEGSVVTHSQIRQYLAGKHAADATCPLTTGIFVHIAAEFGRGGCPRRQGPHNALLARGERRWRVEPEIPRGTARQAERLREEGHRIQPARGKIPPRVVLAPT